MLNQTVTFFKGLRSTKPVKTMPILEVLQEIQNGTYKDKVLPCQSDLSKKDYLPCFTPTGVFNHRSIKGLEEYNGIMCLDIDHVEDPIDLKSRASKLNYVGAAFVTPSGKGLKVIIPTNATAENYKEMEEKVSSAFFHDAGAARDNRCKDIARIQFVSYDPDIYINENAVSFPG